MAFWQWMGLAVAAAVICMVVQAWQPQIAGLCAMAAGVLLLLSALENLQEVRGAFERLAQMGGLDEGYLSTLVRVLGVGYTAELASQTCQDLGQNGLALKVGLAGKLCMFSLTAPLLFEMLEMILGLVP